MIYHFKKGSDTFGQYANYLLNKEKTKKTNVRNTVRNRPTPSETKKTFRTLSDSSPKSKYAKPPINTEFVRLSEMSDEILGKGKNGHHF